MESLEYYIINDIDNYKISEPLVLMSNNIYSTIISQINMNYLLIIFTMGCVSSLFMCHRKDKEYVMVTNGDIVK